MRRWFPIALIVLLSACAGDGKDKKFEDDKPVDILYNEAADAEAEGSLKKAAKLFEEVERQHPYSTWAKQAQIMYPYVLYQDGQYDEAVIAIDRYLDLHPASAEAPYALSPEIRK
jgi:outer membrane protein assembly factor BamD